jgi:hypothetical protein
MRGCFLFKAIALFGLLFGGIAFVIPHLVIWIGFAFLVSGLSLVALFHVRFRCNLLAFVMSNKGAIYWVQKRPMNSNLTKQALSGKQSFRVHLKNGENLDIDVLSVEIEYFIKWVNQRNSHVTWADSL